MQQVNRLIEFLKCSNQILVFTGAGVSTGSGIPDFRGPQGLWKTHQPVLFEDFMSSQDARDEYWDQKYEMWPLFRDATPNSVHQAIYHLERVGKVEMVVTQNIDGLHRRAGTSDDRLVELHGTNSMVECMSCHRFTESGIHMDRYSSTRQAPVCSCGGYLKPATISFGQNLRSLDLARVERCLGKCDLVVALGTTLSVHPAASFPLIAAKKGVPYVVINRGVTDHDGHPSVSLRIDDDVMEIYPQAVAAALAGIN